MRVLDALSDRRSIRRFLDKPVPHEALRTLVEVARLAPSAGNQQPLRYAIVSTPSLCSVVFAQLHWAMYLPDFSITSEQRPMAYILLLSKHEACQFDAGAAAMSILLGAKDLGLESCCLGIAKSEPLLQVLGLPSALHPIVAIALGYGAQRSCVVSPTESLHYRQEPDGSMVVPKLRPEDVLLFSDL